MTKLKWLPIVGFEGVYEVSNTGMVKSLIRKYVSKELILKHKIDTGGYPFVCLNSKPKVSTIRIHRLVAMAFIPNPLNKREVNHINGIKTDNRVENLEWVSSSENKFHSSRTGLMTKGSDKKNSVLTAEIVLAAKRLRESGRSVASIAKEFKVNTGTLNSALIGQSWAYIK